MADTTWNRIFLLGYLTRRISVRYRGDGTPVAEMGVSVSRTFVGDADDRDGGSGGGGYLDVVHSGPTASRLPSIAGKGSAVFVEGSLRFEPVRASHGGGRRFPVLVARRVSLLDTAALPAPGSSHALDLGIELGAPVPPRRRLPGPDRPAPRARSPDRRARVPAGMSGDLFARFG